jgi:hypothetical protein
MSAWTTDELDTIGEAHEPGLTTFHTDGTPRKPVTIAERKGGGPVRSRSHG